MSLSLIHIYVGVINDANPTSSDAILAQSQTLVLMAQQLNTGNGDAQMCIRDRVGLALKESKVLDGDTLWLRYVPKK